MRQVKSLEDRFHKEMLFVYKRALSECKHDARIFLRMVNEYGGVEAAKRLLSERGLQYGFEQLWKCGCLHLTMEALVIVHPWSSLFLDSEISIAWKRLESLGYFTKTTGNDDSRRCPRCSEKVIIDGRTCRSCGYESDD